MELLESPDFEVAQVLASGLSLINPRSSGVRSQPTLTTCTTTVSTAVQIRPATVMTNYSRGNIFTMTAAVKPFGIHQMAAQGEIVALKKELKTYDVNEQDSHGYTPIMWAARYDQIETVQYLVKQGANCCIHGNQGENMVAMAACEGNDDIVQLLLDTSQCDLNETDNSDNNALMYAAHGGHIKCVELLLHRGADIGQRNKHNMCAFDIAVIGNTFEVQKAIEKHMIHLMSSI